MSENSRALVVEDERSWQGILSELLADRGLIVDVVDNLEAAIAAVRSSAHRIAVVDLSLNVADYGNRHGLLVLDAIRRFDPGCVAVLLTGFATVELAVSVLNEYGAYTCLRKEAFRRSQFQELLDRALTVAPLPETPGAPALEVARPGAAPGIRDRSDDITVESENKGAALLVEDDAGWRSLLSELLVEAGYQVRASNSYGEALGHLRREKFAVAVVDLSLASSVAPDGNQDGYQVLAGTRGASTPTVVVSGSAVPTGVERAYAEYGIFAYLEKQGFQRAAFRTAVAEAAAAGKPDADPLSVLTPRERDVLELLVQGLTNKGIANALVISTNTVKRYLKSIFEKLDVDSRSAATARAVSAGMRPGPRT